MTRALSHSFSSWCEGAQRWRWRAQKAAFRIMPGSSEVRSCSSSMPCTQGLWHND